MSMKFIYNLNTRRLHIEGYCRETKNRKPDKYMTFNTENEALAYDGRSVGMCKMCLKERERRDK